MSLPVAFSDVTERIAEYGARAALITVDADSAPHVVSVLVRTDDDRVLAEVGGRTHANLAANPKLSMLWPPLAGGQYHLIVDGLLESVTSVSDSGVAAITVQVTKAILHRIADATGDGPSCVALGDRSGLSTP